MAWRESLRLRRGRRPAAGREQPQGAAQCPANAGQRIVEGASFRLVDEVRYIVRRAANYLDGRVVIGGGRVAHCVICTPFAARRAPNSFSWVLIASPQNSLSPSTRKLQVLRKRGQSDENLRPNKFTQYRLGAEDLKGF